MLTKLKYSVTFPTTGKTFANEVDFQNGITCIHGRNEAGKSLIMEMVRYALFGKAALRGAAGDYKSLEVELEFQFGGKAYTITKSRKHEQVMCDGTVQAVSTSAVDKFMPDLLGFGLNVFDIANAAKQKDLDALSNLKPTERKRLVDSVIGLDVVENIQKWISQEALTLEREGSGMKSVLTEPEVPACPDGYVESAKIQVMLEAARAIQEQAQGAKQILARQLEEPVAPNKPDTDKTLEQLKEDQRKRDQLVLAVNDLRVRIARIPEAEYSVEQLDEAEALHQAWDAYQAYQKALPDEPELTEAKLKKLQKQMDLYQKQVRLEHLQAGCIECPECGENISLDSHEEIKVLTAELGGKTIKEPEVTQGYLDKQARMIALWKDRPAPVKEPKMEPSLTASQISCGRDALNNKDERDMLNKQHIAQSGLLEGLPVVTNLIAEMTTYQVLADRFTIDLQNFSKWIDQCDGARQFIEDNEGIDEQVLELNTAFSRSVSYESLMKSYEGRQQEYLNMYRVAQAKEDDAKEYRKAAESLKKLRAKVKQHLVPSLNQVASKLLSIMTNGERNVVEVSEDFDINIDGQPIQTLSGSGSSCANLAIRLGLGQVLTNRVFSVFLGDELDSAMDEQRTAGTTEALRMLGSMIKQIVVISHREVEADHYVEV